MSASKEIKDQRIECGSEKSCHISKMRIEKAMAAFARILASASSEMNVRPRYFTAGVGQLSRALADRHFAFLTAHLEEGRFVALILTAGMQIVQQDESGGQYRISYLNGHFGSAIDGVIIGCPDMPDPATPILTEMKTHNDKSFAKLKTDGVRESKYEHYVQMQEYMLYYGLPAALYIAVNKNTDEIWAEIVPFERDVAERYKDRGHVIVLADAPPPKMSRDKTFWKCKWCEHRPVCHLGEMPEVNCRTCKHSYAQEDGTWRCGLKVAAASAYITDGSEGVLSKEDQLAACTSYEAADYYG